MTVAEPAQETAYEKLRGNEAQKVSERREAFDDLTGPVVGLALSGGGIRSATFCLGFLQALSQYGLLKRVDFLSTVSGGSYIGGFLGALFVPAKRRGYAANAPSRPSFDAAQPLQSELGLEAVRRLRDAGRYLTPAGTSDAFFAAAVVSRNWAAVQTVIGLTMLFALWCVRLVDSIVAVKPWHGFSPSLLAVGFLFAILVFATGSAYWLTRREWIPKSRLVRILTNSFFGVFLAAFLFMVWVVSTIDWSVGWTGLALTETFIAAFMGTAIAAYLLAELCFGKYVGSPDNMVDNAWPDADVQLVIAAEDKVRSAVTDWMSWCLMMLLASIGVAMLDWLGYWLSLEVALQRSPAEGSEIQSYLPVWTPYFLAILPPVLTYVTRRGLRRKNTETKQSTKGNTISERLPALAILAGTAVVSLWVVLWSAISHYGFDAASTVYCVPTIICIVLFFVNIVQSLCFSFINLSSLSTFYASRLRRAYLGASSYGKKTNDVRHDDPQDTIRVEDYYETGIEAGAPLHLINITIAETKSGTSNLVSRDRKGKPMHLSPCGIVFEGDKPGEFNAQTNAVGEQLPLANWIAISGAAVSAAIGSGTSLGTSILATMANLRLGYWWKSKRVTGLKAIIWNTLRDSVQNYLFLELRGAFDGTRRRRWYLTDGGHFENTGLYSLLMREVGLIIACDNGADPTYDMVDVLRLVQRARVDLGVKITFLTEVEISSALGPTSPLVGRIGTLQELAQVGNVARPGGPIAALAKIDYGNDLFGTLLLIKPRLTFTEPPELIAYYKKPGGRSFPQQTTADQFFDEEQWEAYRRLGEISGEILFAPGVAENPGWLPANMRPLHA